MNHSFTPDVVLFDVVWTLSGSGHTAGQYLHRWSEPCAHTPDQIMEVLARLDELSLPALLEFAGKLSRVKDARRRLWGAEGKCELCRKLEAIAEDRSSTVSSSGMEQHNHNTRE